MAGTLENDAAFRDKLHELMDEYGIVDYSIAGMDSRGGAIAFWIAGIGERGNEISDYQRIAVMAMMLNKIKNKCLNEKSFFAENVPFKDEVHELMEEYGIEYYAATGRGLTGKPFYLLNIEADENENSNFEKNFILGTMLQTLNIHCLTKSSMPTRK